jgi:hypothetical protein
VMGFCGRDSATSSTVVFTVLRERLAGCGMLLGVDQLVVVVMNSRWLTYPKAVTKEWEIAFATVKCKRDVSFLI